MFYLVLDPDLFLKSIHFLKDMPPYRAAVITGSVLQWQSFALDASDASMYICIPSVSTYAYC